MRVGYARVSTDDQTLDLQRDALTQARCRQIYEEHASGKSAARPELEACLKALREGDTLVIWRLDRLGRSLADLIRLTNDLKSRGVELQSLTENLETGTPTGKLVFHVFAALAEFERNLIRERTLAGLKAARARGRKGGRPRKLQAKDLKTIRALLKTHEISVQEIAGRFLRVSAESFRERVRKFPAPQALVPLSARQRSPATSSLRIFRPGSARHRTLICRQRHKRSAPSTRRPHAPLTFRHRLSQAEF